MSKEEIAEAASEDVCSVADGVAAAIGALVFVFVQRVLQKTVNCNS